MPDHKSLPTRPFVPGQKSISAKVLTALAQASMSTLVGAPGKVSVNKFGSRVSLDTPPDTEYNPVLVRDAIILKEFDDYLEVASYVFGPDAYALTPGEPTETIKVASASWSANVLTVTTSDPHTLLLNDTAVIIGATPSAYNGLYTVATIVNPYTFTASKSSNPGAYQYSARLFVESVTLYVAKPLLLQRTPWDKNVVPYPDGTYHYFEYKSSAVFATVNAGGSGYAVEDEVTELGGTFDSAAKFKVTSISGGVVLTVEKSEGGMYDVVPNNPVSVAGGGGTGCKLDVQYLCFHRNNTVVVPMLDGTGNFLKDGSNYLFTSKFDPILETITPEYIVGEALKLISSPTGLYEPYIRILSASWSSQVLAITTDIPHNITFGQYITISDATPSQYNGKFYVTSIFSETSLGVTMLSSPGASYSGGGILSPSGGKKFIHWTDMNTGGRAWAGGGGSDSSFLALLTAKQLPVSWSTGDTRIKYTGMRVTDTDTTSGSPFTAYEVNNVNVPVGGPFKVRMWLGAGNYFIFGVPPEWEYTLVSVGDTITIAGVVYDISNRLGYDQDTDILLLERLEYARDVNSAF